MSDDNAVPLYAEVRTLTPSSPSVPTCWWRLPVPDGGVLGPVTKSVKLPDVVVDVVFEAVKLS